jgi:hypothetical protein
LTLSSRISKAAVAGYAVGSRAATGASTGARENHSAAAAATAYATTSVTIALAVPGFCVMFQTMPSTRATFVNSAIQRPGCRVISPRMLAERTGSVLLQCRRELVRGPLRNDGSLESHHCEARNRHGDPAGVPRPDVRRHVRTGGEEPKDRDRERSADLARDSPPRDRVRKRLRAAELEDAYEKNRGRPDPDEEREQVQVENHVVRLQRKCPS